jgi:hypothetical protein
LYWTRSSEQVSDVNRLLPAARCKALAHSDDPYLRPIIQCEDVPNVYGVVALKRLEDLTVAFGSQPSWVTSDAAVVNSYLNHAAYSTAAVRELHPWRDEPVVQDVNERLLALMTRN